MVQAKAEGSSGAGRERVLVAGLGDVLLTDGGFGVEVVRRLMQHRLPPGVRVHEYGSAGIHLACDLLDGFDLLVLVDALSRGEEPGSVSVLEVTEDDLLPGARDGHHMDPATVLSALHRLGGTLPRTVVVACEPAVTGEGLGLSPVVARAVEPTLTIVLDLVERELATTGQER